MSVNKACILGNVTKDPTIRQTQDGKDIASFSIATNESWKNKDGSKAEKVEFHNIVVFGGQASVVKNYVKKGSQLYIEGKLQTRKWQDKEGNDKYTTEIVLQGFNSILQMIGGESDGKEEKPQLSQQDSQAFEELDDIIPF